jgi:hypothetical protein
MSGTAISSQSQLISWNGNGNAYLTAGFTLTINSTTYNKFPITINSGVIFDGQGKAITVNLNGAYTFSGLFRLKSTDSSTIKNITFNISSNILGVMNAGNGCIVSETSYDGTNPQCNFEGCKVVLSGKLKSSCGAYVGVVDSNYTSSLSFTKCYVSMTEIGQFAGGFIAYSGPLYGDPVTPIVNTFTFSKCYAVASTGFTSDHSSMFCGYLNSCQLTISECISRPVFHVSAPSHVSGFANISTNVTGSITNCYCIFTTLVSHAVATGTGQWYKMPSTTVYLDSGASVTVSITDFYALPLSGATNTAADYNYDGRNNNNTDPTYGVTFTRCAFPGYADFQSSTNATSYSDVIYTYTNTSSVSGLPFSSFDTSTIWTFPTTTQPPLLQAFQSWPYTNYTAYDSTITSTPCFLEGTSVMVFNRGYIPVEDICEDDVLVTENGSTTRIQEIRILYVNDEDPVNKPVLIPQDAFQQSVPCADLYLSPWHAIVHPLTKKWVHAMHLSKDHTQPHSRKPTYIYYTFRTTSEDDRILVENIWCETYSRPYLWDCSHESECCIKKHPLEQ